MARHKCAWRMSYTLKMGETTEEVQYCESGNHFERRTVDARTRKVLKGWAKDNA